jgi:hypothetical protein
MSDGHSIIAVTPAGRRHYLEILKQYVLSDASICEWQLWDNCRRQSDRDYIEELARRHPKIRIVRAPAVDGSNKAINQFYQGLTDRNCFYIKMDDDIVYLPKQFGRRLYEAARAEEGQFVYWSPLVINNAICSWLIKHHSGMSVQANVIAAASCATGWRNPFFAESLHRAFIEAIDGDWIESFAVPNFKLSLARFSINCIGFFGSDVARLGIRFCPPDCDDEEWISAVLPSNLGKFGRIIGDLVVAHFSFFTQETELLRSGILDEYFRIAEVDPVSYPKGYGSLRKAIRRYIELRVIRRYRRGAPITARAVRAQHPQADAANLQADAPS